MKSLKPQQVMRITQCTRVHVQGCSLGYRDQALPSAWPCTVPLGSGPSRARGKLLPYSIQMASRSVIYASCGELAHALLSLHLWKMSLAVGFRNSAVWLVTLSEDPLLDEWGLSFRE